MSEIQNISEWKGIVTPALDSKAEEFQLMGYNQATSEDVWDCLIKKVWKGNPEKRLHEIVHDIMHMDSGTYLSYLTLRSYENDDLRASISAVMNPKEEIDEKS